MNSYPKLTLLLFGLAVVLRLLLCSQNPPNNSFDDHYEPISLILKTGEVPRKDACFECYNPPVFYTISAITANALDALGCDASTVQKILQFQNCFYNILSLLVIFLITKRIPFLTDFPRFIAFGTVCFLPRHIYMAAIFSNDNLCYLGVAICSYLILVIMDRGWNWSRTALLSITASLTIFVKYTGFVVLPMITLPLCIDAIRQSPERKNKYFVMLFVTLLPPLLLLGSYMMNNYDEYGKMLPWNDNFINTSQVQPRDSEPLNFVSFTPWQYMRQPLQTPGQLHSFWTLIYTNTWFDTEPKFLHFTDWDKDWWNLYWSWRTGETTFPAGRTPLSGLTHIVAIGLLTLGIIPLCMVISGLYNTIRTILLSKEDFFRHKPVFQFFILLVTNTTIVIWLAVKAPVFSSMKASYLLSSLPAFGIFNAIGIQLLENKRMMRFVFSLTLVLLVVFTSLHIMHIAWSVNLWKYQ